MAGLKRKGTNYLSFHVSANMHTYRKNIIFVFGEIHSIRTYILVNRWNHVSIHTRNWEVMDIPQKRAKINK